jgi:hypothetical protein
MKKITYMFFSFWALFNTLFNTLKLQIHEQYEQRLRCN